MIGDKRTYKKEIGKVKIEYACGHTWDAPRHYVTKHKSGMKTIYFFVQTDDDFTLCPYCKLQQLKGETK